MNAVQKIELLLEGKYDYVKDRPAVEPPKNIGKDADALDSQKIAADGISTVEKLKTPKGLDMIGDDEGTKEAFSHQDIVKALNSAHDSLGG